MSVLRLLAQSFAAECLLGLRNRETGARRRRVRLNVTILEDRTAPALLTVNSLADGPVSAASSALTLREAVALIDTGGAAVDSSGNSLAAAKSSQIDAASPFGVNDVIQFAPNLLGSAPQQIVLVDGSLVLDQNAIVSGPGASQLAVSGNNQSTVFEVAAGVVVRFSGLTIEAGAASGNSGGGIVNAGTLTLTNTIISGNTVVQGNGGGIFNSGTLTLVNSTVSGNAAVNDGGLDNSGALTLIDSAVSGNTGFAGNGGLANYGTAALVNSTVSGNTAGVGGGIVNYATLTLNEDTVSGNTATRNAGIVNVGVLTLTESTVSGNTVVWVNGGVANYAALTLIDSTISGNRASIAGGLGNYDSGTATLLNSTVSGNSASLAGGIYNTATLTLVNSTVSSNAALQGAGGGILSSGTLTLANTIVSGNTAVQGNGGIDSSGTLTSIDSTVSGNSGDSGATAAPTDRAVSAHPAGNNVALLNPAAPALTDSALSGDTIRNEDSSGETDSPTLADRIPPGNLAEVSANTGETPPNDGGSPGAGNDGDAPTPIENALSGRLAGDGAVWSDSTGKGDRVAEPKDQTRADGNVNTGALTLGGAVSRFSAGDAREERGTPSGWNQETPSPQSRVYPAGEGAASAMVSESNTQEDWAERFSLLDREGSLDQEPGVQAAWTTGHLAGLLLLPWFANDGRPIEEPLAQPKESLERNEDRL